MSTSESSVSLWKTLSTLLDRKSLSGKMRADVCIVGGGIAGLSVAYRLLRAGKSVIVLESKSIAGGETAQTSAHLSSALDDRYYNLEKIHGSEGARMAYLSHNGAIDNIEDIVASENIECDFRRVDGYLFLGEGDHPETLQKEMAAAHRAGFTDVEYLDHLPLPSVSGPCLKFPRQAQLQPLAYIQGLVKAIEAKGGQLFTKLSRQFIRYWKREHGQNR